VPTGRPPDRIVAAWLPRGAGSGRRHVEGHRSGPEDGPKCSIRLGRIAGKRYQLDFND